MKRILAMALSVLLIAGMAIGGSVAYLTGTDSDTNVFTMGDVEIEQHEYVREDDAESTRAKEFDNEDGYLLLPAHGYNEDNTRDTRNISVKFGESEYRYGLWKTSDGARDKIVTVENTGKTAAYVRTVFAFEDTLGADAYIIKNWKDTSKLVPVDGSVSINGELYKLYTYTYTAEYANKLEPGTTTEPSLMQVVMSQEAGNELVDAIAASKDGKYTIYVATQAVQAENMTDLDGKGALDAAFGAVTADNNPWTRGEAEVEDAADAGEVKYISSKADLQEKMGGMITRNTTFVLTKDIDMGGADLHATHVGDNANSCRVKFVGNGHTISNVVLKPSTATLFGIHDLALFNVAGNMGAQLTIENLTLKGVTANGDATSAAAVVGYVNGNSTVTLNNVDVYNANIKNTEDNASVFVGYTTGKVTMTGCDAYGCKIEGGNSDKTGAFVGTANTSTCTVSISNCANNAKYNGNQARDIGRELSGATVTLNNVTKVALAISDLDDLKAFADSVNENGKMYDNKTVVLLNDIDMNSIENWKPIGQTGTGTTIEFAGTFDGNGHTIKNLKVKQGDVPEADDDPTAGQYACGLFGYSSRGTAVIKNLTIDNATIEGSHYTGAIIGYISGNSASVQNCTVKNSTIKGICKEDENDDYCGDKVGAITGMIGDASAKVKNCKVENVAISAGRDAGYVVGAAYASSVENCRATDTTVTALGECTAANINNSIIGRQLGA